ncbi:uncharacterized protein LOC111126105 isoform X1 [Crassostrea virginica]
MCYTYDPIICVVYKSWAEIQCACFCHIHGQNRTPTSIPPTTSKVTSSQHLTHTAIQTTSPSVSTVMVKPVTCFTCEDYFNFRCQSFATECANTCMIRYKNGNLESKCTLDLECRNAQQSDFLNSGTSTRCCRTSHCVSETLQEAVKAHHAFIGTQTTSQVEMSSLNTTKSTSLPTKTTHGKSTGTTFDSTNFMTTDSTLDTPSQLTSGISPNSFVNTKLSSSPLTSAVTKQWPFVTIPVGKRRRIFRINKFG